MFAQLHFYIWMARSAGSLFSCLCSRGWLDKVLVFDSVCEGVGGSAMAIVYAIEMYMITIFLFLFHVKTLMQVSYQRHDVKCAIFFSLCSDNGELTVLPAGRHEYPFSFQLPEE